MDLDKTLPNRITALPVVTLTAELVLGPNLIEPVRVSGEVISIGAADDNDLRVPDSTVSRYHLELSAAAGGVLVKDLGSTNGTRIRGVDVQEAVVPIGSLIEIGQSQLRVLPAETGDAEIYTSSGLGDLVGQSGGMRRLMARVAKLAQSDIAVLVEGESGTGKTVIARTLHSESARASGPFVYVDCGALPANLVSSELFGHEKGAFTGATGRHAGAFERAHKGTLFLDEIGELPLSVQPALLGAIQRKSFRRVGGEKEIQSDFRIVAATNRDLRTEVNREAFRLDLYYRIAVARMRVQPLRERQDDIPALVAKFWQEAGHTEPLAELLPPSEMQRWMAHPWPGNVRELRNAVEATIALREPVPLENRVLVSSTFDTSVLDAPSTTSTMTFSEVRDKVLERFEKHYFEKLLARTNHNVSLAAREAKLDRTYLHGLIKRHGL